MTDWSEVHPGDVVRGARDGKAWEVVSRGAGSEVTIKNGERSYTFAPQGSVEVIATSDEMLAAAEAAVKIIMPGSVQVAEYDAEKNLWICPNTFPDEGSAQAHLYVLHGERSKGSTLLDILSEHLSWHDQGKQVHPHVHSKNFWTKGS